MMSEAEEMLLATRGMNNTKINRGNQIADPPVDLEAPLNTLFESQPGPGPASALTNAPGIQPSQTARSKPLLAPVTKQRHTRASTSDSRKGDHRVSSSIVAMSSTTVGPSIP